MPMTINTNVVSLNAQRNLSTNQVSLATSRRLSGLVQPPATTLRAWRSRHMKAQKASTSRANANDGISLAQNGSALAR